MGERNGLGITEHVVRRWLRRLWQQEFPRDFKDEVADQARRRDVKVSPVMEPSPTIRAPQPMASSTA